MNAERLRPGRAMLAAAGAILVLLVAAAAAEARGGGGGGFGGGGGGGDGGGGGGGGGGEIVFWLVFQLLRLCIHAPAIGIPLTLAVIAFIVYSARRANEAHTHFVIDRGRGAFRENRGADAVARLRAADPAFDPEAFLGRVRRGFLLLQESWCRQDLAPLRPFVSDGIHERFALQIAEQRDLGYRDRMDGLAVAGATLVEAEAEGPFDAVTVRIAASAADYRVALDGGAPVSGVPGREEFVEYWTFLRRRGARTAPGGRGLLEGCCPSCGAAVELNQWTVCKSCNGVLRSGAHDWVLTEITQESVWRPAVAGDLTGVPALRARDPGFSLAHLEDRASVMFWRGAMAERLATADPLRRIASPAYCAARDEALRPLAGKAREFFGERAVGAVETRGILAGSPRDRAVVRVLWSGVRFTAGPGKRPERGEKGPVRGLLLVLERAAGVVTDRDGALSAAHCGKCGGPDPGPEGKTGACPWCGTVLDDGSRDWVLAEAWTPMSPEGQAVLAALEAAPAEAPAATLAAVEGPVDPALLAWAAAVVSADGVIGDRERAGLERIGRTSGVFTADPATLPAPASPAEARLWLRALAALALSDGRLDGREWAVLERLGKAAGLESKEVGLVVAKVRGDLYREARSEIRARRDRKRAG